MPRVISRGICRLCQAEYGKPGMARHLETCWQKAGVQAQNDDETALKTKVFHLLIEGSRLPMYWLHLQVDASITLSTLDQFLRGIWLECCGHLSAFEIDGLRYSIDAEMLSYWSDRVKDMEIPLDQALKVGQTSSYEYDFGSTTELRIKVLAEREVFVSGDVIQLLARNKPPFADDDPSEPNSPRADVCGYVGPSPAFASGIYA